LFRTTHRSHLKSIVLAAAAIGWFLAGISAATALPPSGPVGKWYRTCMTAKDCLMTFQTQAGGVNSLQITNSNPPRSPVMAIRQSTNALLPFGSSMQLDGQPAVRIPFMLCNDGTCTAQLVINDDFLNQLRNGSVLHMSYQEISKAGPKVRKFNISLKGFAAILDGN
jgi:invasion protein IalB